ncbi:MAG: hypothetical protein B9S32_03810 [Verrucomicrobia bacterium Tous-C9LFEB]|nr:MAG: hypothetical protein B9S32_03810 [Verrucomicrobia bacterium Tous-C9LFEB]
MKPITIPVTVRLHHKHYAQLATERTKGHCDRSEAMRRLMDRASEAQEPVYLNSQIGHRRELHQFCQLLTNLLPLSTWSRRLSALQTTPESPDQTKLILECQATLTELTEVARSTLQETQRMGEILNGMTMEDYSILKAQHSILESCRQSLVEDLKDPALSESDRDDLNSALQAFDAEMRMLKILGFN